MLRWLELEALAVQDDLPAAEPAETPPDGGIPEVEMPEAVSAGGIDWEALGGMSG